MNHRKLPLWSGKEFYFCKPLKLYSALILFLGMECLLKLMWLITNLQRIENCIKISLDFYMQNLKETLSQKIFAVKSLQNLQIKIIQ